MTTTPHSDDTSQESARASATTAAQADTSVKPPISTHAPAPGDAEAPHSGAAHGHHRPDLSHRLFSHSVPGTEVKKQISYIAPGQTVKALMLAYLTFSVPIVLLALVAGFVRNGGEMDIRGALGTLFSALLLNGIVGFVLLWIACRAYNWVASRFGGIEITLSDPPKDV